MNQQAPIGKTEAVTILCVEDCPAILALLKETLQRAGYDVLQASEGGDGLALFFIHGPRIDAVIVDFHLPDMTGKDVAVAIRKVQPNFPIILFSGDARIFSGLIPEIFDACIEKPRLADIPNTIKQLLNTRSSRHDVPGTESGSGQSSLDVSGSGIHP